MRRNFNSNIHNLNQTDPNKMRIRPWAGLLIGCVLLSACQSSKIQSSKDHFLRPTDPPYRHNTMLNPAFHRMTPPDEKQVSETPDEVYTITVTEMSVRDLLFALARDAGVNIDIYPGIDGKVTLSAIDQTLPQILDRIAKQVEIRYEINEGTIIISPDMPYLKIYEVDYINIVRSSKSSNEVSTKLSNASLNSKGSANDDSNMSTTSLNTDTTNNFWKTLSSNIETILNPGVTDKSAEPIKPEAENPEGADDLIGLTPEEFEKENSAKATTETPTIPKSGIMALNSESGQISVFASAAQHERIQELLDATLGSAHRQVMIESTVVEVELSDRFQEGVDWDMMFNAAGDIGLKGIFSNAGELFSLGRDPNPSSAVTSTTAIRAAIKILETFGNTKVLSSPKITALNNQPAMLKVVQNKVFFTMKSTTSTTSVTGDTNTVTSTPTFDTEIHTVPVGLIMSVTPQISKDDIITMNVRPTITRITQEVNDPNPALRATDANGLGTDISSLIPEIEVKEMETVMRIHSGQVAVMGGLMQDKIENTSNGLPGLGKLPGVGFLFSHKDRKVTKTELVVFLRPVIVAHDSPKQRRGVMGRYQSQRPQSHAPISNQPQHMVTMQPQEDVAPGYQTMVNAPMAQGMSHVSAQGGSYLDFTNQPRQLARHQQPTHGGIAPPPAPPQAAAPIGFQPAAYQQQQQAPQRQQLPPNAPPPGYQQAPAYPAQQSQHRPNAMPQANNQNQNHGFFVDLGSYLEQTHADDIQRKINAIGLPTQQNASNVKGQTYQRVRSGPFPNQELASQAMAKITNYTGIQARVSRF
ncbi:MAG: pilus (MSHA type) biogenesis protein MshL [Magnetococcales bacterium]|nr:pilus (MSHA type) biogenesis protein MshL [Magnetococcales bacterium]